MFLYDCITNITNITNKFLEILYNYNYDYDYDYDYAIDKSQVIRCLDKEYMYDNYCDISIETCTSIQNNIIYDPNIAIYNNSIYNVKYLYISFYISSLFIIIYFCCIKTKQKVINITSNNISLLDEEAPILNNNYYLIDKNDTVPKYNEIESETNKLDISNTKITKKTIIDVSPPKYNEINIQ